MVSFLLKMTRGKVTAKKSLFEPRKYLKHEKNNKKNFPLCVLTHLPVAAHDHLLASEHDVGGPLQAGRKEKKKSSLRKTHFFLFCALCEETDRRRDREQDRAAASYPSRMDSLQQYRLSNFCLVTESLTFMAGTHSFPALDSWYNLERDRDGGASVGGGRGTHTT